MVRRVLAYVVAGLVGTACGGTHRAPPPAQPIANHQPAPEATSAPGSEHGSAGDQQLAMLNAFSEKMCGCSDSMCVQGVNAQMATWAQDIASRPENDQLKMTDDQMKVARQLAMRMGECMSRAQAGSGAASPPSP